MHELINFLLQRIFYCIAPEIQSLKLVIAMFAIILLLRTYLQNDLLSIHVQKVFFDALTTLVHVLLPMF